MLYKSQDHLDNSTKSTNHQLTNHPSDILLKASSLYTPETCHSSTRIREFLRLSRLASDDSIKEHLNETTKEKCDSFFRSQLLPHWSARADLILYCSDEASNLRSQVRLNRATSNSNVDLTLDPYAVKDANQKLKDLFAACEAIENWVSNERLVENIIQEHSADVLNRKCYYYDWLQDFRRSYPKN